MRGNPVNLTDPSGRIAPLVAAGLYVGAAALIGGLVGGLVGGVGGLIHQLRQNGGDWSCLDVNAIADSALKSAIIGAIGGAAGALAAMGFAAIGTAVGVGGSAAAGAMNVFASSVIGGQFARHTGALLYGGSYRPSLGDIALDGVLGTALFGAFAAGRSIWNGARGISQIARGIGDEFGYLIPTRPETRPIGFTDRQWKEFQRSVYRFVDEAGLPEGELFVQGSRVPGSPKVPRGLNHPKGQSDIDVMLGVSDETFADAADRILTNSGGRIPAHAENIEKQLLRSYTLSNYWPDRSIYNKPFHNYIGSRSPFAVFRTQFSMIPMSTKHDVGHLLPILRR